MQEKYPQKPGLDFILKQAFYYADTLAKEVFMHCSTEDKVAGVL